MSIEFAGPMTAERFAGLPLKQQFIWWADYRKRLGLPMYNYGDTSIRESVAGNEGDIRESASTSDMPNILGNNIYRELDNWFAQYDGQWQRYCNQVELVDYRPKVIGFVSELEDALEVRQERDIQDSALLDKGYQVALKNWARQITLPFIVIENDDKGFIRQIPQKMINAADRTIQKLVVRNTLEANLTAYDGLALFSSSRNPSNLISGAGSAFSNLNLQSGIATVQSAIGDLDLNPSGTPLNIPARYLVVPTALEFQAAQLLNSAFLLGAATSINNNPWTAGGLTNATAQTAVTTVGASNPLQMGGFQTPIQLIVERYLASQTAWYLLPDGQYGPVTVGVRQGRGLRPRVWVNTPQRQAMLGGGADDYLLSISDLVYGFSLDLNAVVAKPWSCAKWNGV